VSNVPTGMPKYEVDSLTAAEMMQVRGASRL
jgi:hypothetical protein